MRLPRRKWKVTYGDFGFGHATERFWTRRGAEKYVRWARRWNIAGFKIIGPYQGDITEATR